MKKIILAFVIAIFSISGIAATNVPVQLLSPTGSTSGQVIASTGPSSAPTWTSGYLSQINMAMDSVMNFGAVSNCANGSGTCTDNLSAFNATIADAQANHRNIFIPCGDYFLSGGITIANTTDTGYGNFRPSLIGGQDGSARCVHLYFGNGNFNGITVAGTNGQNPGALSMQVVSGISVSKSDYQGYGFAIQAMDHIYMLNDYAQQFQIGFYLQDVQESLFENIFGQFNAQGGLQALKGTFTPPNALAFKGSSFSANGAYGVDIQNPSVVSFDGGAIEQNGYNGGGNNWGIRAIYNYNTDVESNQALYVHGVYFERNSGTADILFSNGQSGPNIPSTVTLVGNNFNRGYNSIGATATISIANPGVITFANHGFTAGQAVVFSTTGSLPTGITAGTTYFVLAAGLTTNTFEISTTVGGSPVVTSGSQSGIQTVYSHANNVVSINEANGNLTTLSMTGNGMGGLPRPGAVGTTYVPSSSTPYVSVLTPADVTICDSGSTYADSVETNAFIGSCSFKNNVNIGNLTIFGTLTPAQTVGIVGTTTNNNVQAGSVGEYICAQVTNGGSPSGCATNSNAPVSLTNATAVNVTSISLTAGDWDVSGNVGFLPAGTTVTSSEGCWISTTSATNPGSPNSGAFTFQNGLSATAGSNVNTYSCGQQRLSLSATTTVYLGSFSAFTTSTSTAYGFIRARRVR